MTRPDLLLPLAASALVTTASAVWLLQRMGRETRLQARVEAIRAGLVDAAPDVPVPDSRSIILRAVAMLGTLLLRSGLLPASTLAQLDETLASAGLRHRMGRPLFIGGKLVLLVLVPVVTIFLLRGIAVSPTLRPVVIGGSAVVGLLAPDFILRSLRARYLKEVARGLPDALDMLVICTEAGLGLELGLERVASEIEPAHPAIAAELTLTSAELRILADRRTALTNMGARTGLDQLKRLGSTLIQTMQYGTPLSQALRTLAAEMRYEMLVRFEAQAARLPVLLTVPMILFILPCIFIVVGGPAGLTVARTLIHH